MCGLPRTVALDHFSSLKCRGPAQSGAGAEPGPGAGMGLDCTGVGVLGLPTGLHVRSEERGRARPGLGELVGGQPGCLSPSLPPCFCAHLSSLHRLLHSPPPLGSQPRPRHPQPVSLTPACCFLGTSQAPAGLALQARVRS